MIFVCIVFFLVVVFAVKVNEYRKNSIYQARIETQLNGITKDQKKIIVMLQGVKTGAVKNQKRPGVADPNKVYDIDLSKATIKGKKDAKVTIVEFSDFQCPYSQKFHPIVMEAINAYPDDVNYVFMSFPLNYHKQAKPATKALLVAKQHGKYWEMLDLLFLNAKQLSQEQYKVYASQLGINPDEFEQKLKNQDAQLEKMIQEAIVVAQKSGVRGTPTFFINGKKTTARSVEDLKKKIDSILK